MVKTIGGYGGAGFRENDNNREGLGSPDDMEIHENI